MKKQLIEARALAFTKADGIAKLAEGDEARSLTPEEMETLRGLHAEIETLDGQIAIAERQEELAAAAAINVPITKPVSHKVPAVHGNERSQDLTERKIIKRFNVLKAMRHLADPINNPLEGVELEIDQEARSEQKDVGISHLVNGGVSIPAFTMRQEQRADEQIAGTDAQGGFTIGSDLVEVIGILRPRTAIRQAGATMLTGLTGNLDFTTQATGAVTNWADEIATSTQAKQTYTQRTMSPHRLAAWTPISLQLLAQSSIDMQQFVINDLNGAMNQALEVAGFRGTGVAPIPTGINGYGLEIEAGTNGAELSYELAIDMETALADVETDFGKLAYIINSKTYGSLKKKKLDAGSGLFTIAQDSNLLNGKRVFISNNLPSNLTKGTASGICSMAVYANWGDLLIGNWGGANLILDPFTSAKEGMINVVTNTFWDFLGRRTNSFVFIDDILTP